MALALFPPRAAPRQGNQPTDIIKDEPIVSVTEASLSRNHVRSDSRSNSPMRVASGRPDSPSRAHAVKQPSLSPIIDSPSSATSSTRSQSPTKGLIPRSQSPTSNYSSNGSVKSSTSSNKSSYLANAKLKAKEAWMRRKGSLSELDTMTTVQEHTMDSPTIPGRPPMHDRQASLPASTWQQTIQESKGPLPKRPPPEFPMNIPAKNAGKTIHSSVSPLQVPPITTITPAQSPTDENPPEVPPKETPKALKAPKQAAKVPPLKISKAPAKITTNISPNANECQKVRVEPCQSAGRGTPSPVKQHRKELPKSDRLPKPEPKHTLSTKAKKQDTPDKAKRKSTNYRALPSGLRPADASKNLQPNVIESLQNAARKTSEKFGVLSPKDVDVLTQELSQLETRCEYLRKTHRELRSGRRELHKKMLDLLKSEHSTGFSRVSLLKQQEALADLDNSIDDWEAKMERAEARRAQVHRKLLEHVAAALSVPAGEIALAMQNGMVTPPATPEEQFRDSKKLDRLQSITVWALMSDVEDMLADKK